MPLTPNFKDYFLEVSKGNVAGHSTVHKFGENPDIDLGANEDVWDAGGSYTYLSLASGIEILSSDTNDASGGTGARRVSISGLDANYIEQGETVDMSGTTVVPLSQSYLRIFRAKVQTAGSNETNLGNITIRVSGAGATQAQITADKGQTLMSLYTIPANKSGYLHDWDIAKTNSTAGALTARLFAREFGGAWQVKSTLGVDDSGSTYAHRQWDYPLKFLGKTDIRIEADGNANNMSLASEFHIILVDD